MTCKNQSSSSVDSISTVKIKTRSQALQWIENSSSRRRKSNSETDVNCLKSGNRFAEWRFFCPSRASGNEVASRLRSCTEQAQIESRPWPTCFCKRLHGIILFGVNFPRALCACPGPGRSRHMSSVARFPFATRMDHLTPRAAIAPA